MNTSKPEVSAPVIVGNVIDLGDGRSAAIYKRDGSCWVAEFERGRGTLIDSTSWFRSHGGALRYSHGRRAAALETMTPITPAYSDMIECLHRRRSAGDARVHEISTSVFSAIERWWVQITCKLPSAARGTTGL